MKELIEIISGHPGASFLLFVMILFLAYITTWLRIIVSLNNEKEDCDAEEKASETTRHE